MSSRKLAERALLKTALLGIVLVLTPLALRATSTPVCGQIGTSCSYFWNGTASGGSTGISMTGTNSGQINQINLVSGENLGSISFTTGQFLAGTLGGGGSFGTGTLTITASGGGFAGTIFNGQFGSSQSPLQWTYVGQLGKNGQYEYELSGSVYGSGGATVGNVQLFFTSPTMYAGGSLSLISGSAQILTPEPGSMSLFGTGLLGLGYLRRKKQA